MSRVRQQPCMACPYRRDVASGVWAYDEYAKLPPYDAPTGEQPFEPFCCHATTNFYCHGWAVVHNNRGHEYELLSLRLFGDDGPLPEPTVPLFSSGSEAAAHGIRDLKHPSREARQTMATLLARYGGRLETKPRRRRKK